ncbi:phosphatidylinositol N-acetylglucosaminyltransferase PWA37_000963 [Arxiozyma heterogenica]|uniref:phosphatidylinositol N-acetylglucosaminyltransferase n=1 Tax=Arxiozyma heterogenica TaxID=278026 RepID=UPI002F1D99F9
MITLLLPQLIMNNENFVSKEIRPKQWKRLLWLRQDDYPDNYTDPEFISYLENLKDIQLDYNYDQIRKDFLKFYFIILNTCFLFITFHSIYEYSYDPKMFTFLTSCIIAIISVMKYKYLTNKQIKSSIIIIFTILTLSPVLKSLSKTTSTDSIWVISFWLTIYYLFSVFKSMTSKDNINNHDNNKDITLNGNDNSDKRITSKKQINRVEDITYSKNLPTNILLANVAMLSSRLPTTTHVFCYLLLCIEINILLPKLINLSNLPVSLLSNIIVYSYINISLGFSSMIIFGIFSVLFTAILPRIFWYWETYYKCKTPEILSLWDTKTPILS